MESYDSKPLSCTSSEYPSVSLIVVGCKIADVFYSLPAVAMVAREEEQVG